MNKEKNYELIGKVCRYLGLASAMPGAGLLFASAYIAVETTRIVHDFKNDSLMENISDIEGYEDINYVNNEGEA